MQLQIYIMNNKVKNKICLTNYNSKNKKELWNKLIEGLILVLIKIGNKF